MTVWDNVVIATCIIAEIALMIVWWYTMTLVTVWFENRQKILIRFGRRATTNGRWFIWKRLYTKKGKWTPFCRVRRQPPKVVKFRRRGT